MMDNVKYVKASDNYIIKKITFICKDIANELGLRQMLVPSDNKNPVNLVTNLSAGVIVGLTSDGMDDSHYVFKNSNNTYDSLDPNRPAAKQYKENTYRVLTWGNIK